MLKLIKYEYRRNLAGIVVMLSGVLLVQAFYLFAIMRKDAEMIASALMLLLFAAFLCGAGILIYSVALYSRELNAKTSYLTFMTPNPVAKILAAKLLAAFLLGIVLVALLVAFAVWDVALLTETYPEFEMSRRLIEQVLPGILNASFPTILTWISMTASLFLISFYTIVMLAYLAITLSATVLQNKRLKGLLSFLVFLGLYAGIQWIVEKLPGVDYEIGFVSAMLSAWPQYAAYLLVIAGSFILSALLLDKKVSL